MTPRSVRNKNPGNVRPRPGEPWPGQVSVDIGPGGPFPIFDTAVSGFDCLASQLMIYGSRGINTVAAAIARWAPPVENDTNAYAAGVAKSMGVGLSDPIDMTATTILHQFAKAIDKIEAGAGDWWQDEDRLAGIAQARKRRGLADDAAQSPAPATASPTPAAPAPDPVPLAVTAQPAAAPIPQTTPAQPDTAQAILNWLLWLGIPQSAAVAERRHFEILERLTTMSETLSSTIASVSTKLDKLSSDFGDLASRVTTTNGTVEKMKSDLDAANAERDSLKATLAAADIAGAQAALKTLGDKMDALDTSVRSIDTSPAPAVPGAPVADPAPVSAPVADPAPPVESTPVALPVTGPVPPIVTEQAPVSAEAPASPVAG